MAIPTTSAAPNRTITEAQGQGQQILRWRTQRRRGLPWRGRVPHGSWWRGGYARPGTAQ